MVGCGYGGKTPVFTGVAGALGLGDKVISIAVERWQPDKATTSKKKNPVINMNGIRLCMTQPDQGTSRRIFSPGGS
jgi:hypothetical protein